MDELVYHDLESLVTPEIHETNTVLVVVDILYSENHKGVREQTTRLFDADELREIADYLDKKEEIDDE